MSEPTQIERWSPMLANPRTDMISLREKLNEVIDVVNHQQHILYNLASQDVSVGKAIGKWPEKKEA